MGKSNYKVQGTEFQLYYRTPCYYFYLHDCKKYVCKYNFQDRIFKMRSGKEELSSNELFAIAVFIAHRHKRGVKP